MSKTISNKIEPQFGCSALAGGFLCIAPEVKSNYSFPQAEFQSFVSGEDVSSHRSTASPFAALKWITPMAEPGAVPGLSATAGSIIRRTATVAFRRQVQNADAGLGGRLKSEVPLLLVKCVQAYIDLLKSTKASGNIWEVLPKQIVDVRKEIEGRARISIDS